MNKGIYILAIATFVAGTVEFLITGLLGMIANDLHTSIGAVGQLVSIYSIVFAIGAPVLVAFSSKIERRKLLLLAMTVFFIGNCLSIISPNFTTLLIARMVLAASCSIVIVVSITTAANIATKEMRGRAIGVIIMGISSSLVFGVPLGTLIGERYGWRMTFVMVGILSLLSIVGLIKFLPKVPPQQIVPLRKQIATLKSKQIISIQLISFFELTGHFTIYTYFVPFIQKTMGLSTNMISFILLVFGIAGILGGWIGGWSADKFGGSKTIIVVLIALGALFFILPFATKALISIYMIIILWGILTWSISPSIQSSLAKATPETADIQVGINNSFSHLGIAFGSSLGGYIVNHYPITSTTWVGGLIVLFGLISAIYSKTFSKESSLLKAS